MGCSFIQRVFVELLIGWQVLLQGAGKREVDRTERVPVSWSLYNSMFIKDI